VDATFTLPGTTGPRITVHRPAIGTIRVLVDGMPAKRRTARTLSYDIALADGSTTELTLKGQWTGLKAVANGVELPLEPTIPRPALAVVFLPLVLVVGGVVGILIGLGGAIVNARLVRGDANGAVKVLAMLGVTVLAVVLYVGIAFGVAVATTPVATLQTGTCVNGIRAGATLTDDVTRQVDCAARHDNEVIGSATYTPDGAFPGEDALKSFADTTCVAAFEPYVGVAFDSSGLDMIEFTPDELSWAKGDHQIGCVVIAGDGGQLTGSVRGTAR
jgi:hypothetical protein